MRPPESRSCMGLGYPEVLANLALAVDGQTFRPKGQLAHALLHEGQALFGLVLGGKHAQTVVDVDTDGVAFIDEAGLVADDGKGSRLGDVVADDAGV